MSRVRLSSLVFTLFALSFTLACYANELTVLYTGDTYAMLYPCDCPREPDGGVARRAALIKQIRKRNPNVLVLDSGGFFAGGPTDQYAQNAELDKVRTLVNIMAMEIMKYDAVGLGEAEFNFGAGFLRENMAKSRLTFLSCNISMDGILPYIIKDVGGLKIGIIAATPASAANKAAGIKFNEPVEAVRQAVDQLKKKGAQVIIALSHLDEGEEAQLLKSVGAVDILISGRRHGKSESAAEARAGPTLVLRPLYQGRSLGKISLTIKDGKITGHKIEELRLSDKISGDPEVLNILPQCFSDANCRKKGMVGSCQAAGTLASACQFSQPPKVKLLIVMPKPCSLCDTKILVEPLKPLFPGLEVSYLYYPGPQAEKLIRELGVKGLPVYLLSREAEKEKGFNSLQESLVLKGDYYMFKPQLSGISYFLNRDRIRPKLDLFISPFDKDSLGLLSLVREYKPDLHFLVLEQVDGFEAQRGVPEIEESLRSVCVQKYYPEYFWDYLTCRAGNIESTWWQDCLAKYNSEKIKSCAQSEEGKGLLGQNIRLNRELEVMLGPVFLLDNVDVFSTQGLPSKEELKKILKR